MQRLKKRSQPSEFVRLSPAQGITQYALLLQLNGRDSYSDSGIELGKNRWSFSLRRQCHSLFSNEVEAIISCLRLCNLWFHQLKGGAANAHLNSTELSELRVNKSWQHIFLSLQVNKVSYVSTWMLISKWYMTHTKWCRVILYILKLCRFKNSFGLLLLSFVKMSETPS